MKIHTRPPAGATAPGQRRFHACVLGLPKTGTTSLAAIFHHYATAHEFMFGQTVEQICAWKDGSITEENLAAFLLRRDRAGLLELDSASFNHYCLDILLREFPGARYIVPLRECRDWTNSYLNMLVRWRNLPAPPAAWQLPYGRLQFPGFDRDDYASPQRVIDRLPVLLEDFFRFWGENNRRILARLPRERALVLRTHELSSSLEKMAGFLSLPTETLDAGRAHAHRGKDKTDFIAHADPQLVSRLLGQHCLDVMEAWFPEFLRSP